MNNMEQFWREVAEEVMVEFVTWNAREGRYSSVHTSRVVAKNLIASRLSRAFEAGASGNVEAVRGSTSSATQTAELHDVLGSASPDQEGQPGR